MTCGKCIAPDSYLAVELCPLHAAAGEMLEALKDVTDFAYELAMKAPDLSPRGDYIIPKARKAIAKAEK